MDIFLVFWRGQKKLIFQKGTLQKRRRNDKHVISLKAMHLQIYPDDVFALKKISISKKHSKFQHIKNKVTNSTNFILVQITVIVVLNSVIFFSLFSICILAPTSRLSVSLPVFLFPGRTTSTTIT